MAKPSGHQPFAPTCHRHPREWRNWDQQARTIQKKKGTTQSSHLTKLPTVQTRISSRGPEDRRTGGPGDQRTRGQEDRGTRGPEDRRTGGPGDQGTRGPEDQRTKKKKNEKKKKKIPQKIPPLFLASLNVGVNCLSYAINSRNCSFSIDLFFKDVSREQSQHARNGVESKHLSPLASSVLTPGSSKCQAWVCRQTLPWLKDGF